LNGTGVKLFGDGLKGFHFPAVAPDGKRIIFIRNDPRRGPTPFLFAINGTGGKPATPILGMWGAPRWQ
jgi:hypothetical protein